MNKSIFAIWAVSLGAAFYGGYLSNHSTERKAEISESSSITAGSLESTGKPREQVTEKRRLKASPDQNRKPVNVVMADLKSILGESGMMSMDIAAISESYNLVKDLNEAELLEALSQLQGDINNPANMMPLMLILGRYAELNPLNAVAFYESNLSTPQAKMVAFSSIISSWSKNDPEGAYEWFQKNGEKDKTGGMMGGNSFGLIYIFQGLAKRDINSAIDKLKTLDNTGFKSQMAANGIASSLRAKEDFIEFLSKTADLSNPTVRSSAVQNWVTRNPLEASEWVDSLKDEKEKKKFSDNILSGWMQTDPNAAISWYMDRVDEKGKQGAVDKVVQQWSFSNPQATLDWISKQEGVDTQKTYTKLLESAAYNNPVFVADNLDKVTDTDTRKRLSQRVYSQLQSLNKDKAKEFYENSPFKDELVNQSASQPAVQFIESP